MTKKPEPNRPTPANQPIEPGRYAYGGLERTVHEKARLGIVTSLAMNPAGLVFNDLKRLCDLTDGNLNRHLAVLEEEKWIDAWKSGGGQKRQTLYRLTAHGRKRLLAYLAELEQVVKDVEQATKAAEPPPTGGWRRAAPA